MNSPPQQPRVLITPKNKKYNHLKPLNLVAEQKSAHQPSNPQSYAINLSEEPCWWQSQNNTSLNDPSPKNFKSWLNQINDVINLIDQKPDSYKQRQNGVRSDFSTHLSDFGFKPSWDFFREKPILLGNDNWFFKNPWEKWNSLKDTIHTRFNKPKPIINFTYGNSGFGENKGVWGNDKQGEEWKKEQQQRHKFKEEDINYIDNIEQENIENQKIVYIEPSISEKKLLELKQKGQIFNDDDFPPNEQSLEGYMGGLQAGINWERISEKMPDQQMFVDKTNPQDIIQGALGDCYFLAGLAALAERPDRIWDLFLLHEKNEQKYFSMKMLYRGKWRAIDIDDWIPFFGNKPAFSRSRQRQLWVILLQKSWAKLYGFYKKIEAGFPEEALHDLTGAPVKIVFPNHPKLEDPWEYLLEASAKEYAMVASSKAGSDTQQSSSGVVQGHAYTFLNATNLKTGYRQEKIVQLRNPWGDLQYRGKWSDMDPGWEYISEEQKSRVGYKKDRHDGIFYMPYEEFRQQFSYLTVAEINDNASYVYQSYWDPESKGAYFVIEVMKSGLYSLQVDKTPERAFPDPPRGERYRYPESQLQLAKISEYRVIRYQGIINRRRSLYKYYDMTPGIYVAFVKISGHYQLDKDREVNLAIYSEYTCKIGLASHQQAAKFTGDQNVDWNYDPSKKTNLLDQIGSGQLMAKNASLYPGAIYAMELKSSIPNDSGSQMNNNLLQTQIVQRQETKGEEPEENIENSQGKQHYLEAQENQEANQQSQLQAYQQQQLQNQEAEQKKEDQNNQDFSHENHEQVAEPFQQIQEQTQPPKQDKPHIQEQAVQSQKPQSVSQFEELAKRPEQQPEEPSNQYTQQNILDLNYKPEVRRQVLNDQSQEQQPEKKVTQEVGVEGQPNQVVVNPEQEQVNDQQEQVNDEQANNTSMISHHSNEVDSVPEIERSFRFSQQTPKTKQPESIQEGNQSQSIRQPVAEMSRQQKEEQQRQEKEKEGEKEGEKKEEQ